jgi:hypothetical protein
LVGAVNPCGLIGAFCEVRRGSAAENDEGGTRPSQIPPSSFLLAEERMPAEIGTSAGPMTRSPAVPETPQDPMARGAGAQRSRKTR